MDRIYTTNLKAIACIFIFLHHYYTQSEGCVQVFGFWMVSVFFLLSAYGLTKSLISREICFLDYCKKRLVKVLVPYLLVNVIVILLCRGRIPVFNSAQPVACFMENSNILDILYYAFGIKMMDGVMWFVNTILLFYVFLYFIKYFKTSLNKLLYITLVTLIYIATFIVMNKHFYSYASILCFPIGTYIALYEDRLRLLMSRLGGVKMVLFTMLWIVFILGGIYVANVHTRFFTKMVVIFAFTIINSFMCFRLSKTFLAKNVPILSWIGGISYEFYLVHMKFISYFHTTNLCDSFLYNPLIMILIILLGSQIIAWLSIDNVRKLINIINAKTI